MALWGLAVIAAMVAVTASILHFIFKTGISPMPSSARARRAMLEAVERAPQADGPIIDLGSGWGTLAIACARRFPERQVVGYELSWVPWAASVLVSRLFGLRNLRLCRANFLHAAWPDQAVVLAYLFTGGMTLLAHKLARDGVRPALLVSNTFALPGATPTETIRLDDLFSTRIYVYPADALARA